MMIRMTKFLPIAALILAAFIARPAPAHAQPGYGGQQTVNCSSNDGRRNYCGQYGNDVRLSRQISGSPCVEGQTWGVDRGGLWVDRGCRADFFVGRGPGRGQTVNCSSNDGRRNYCGQYGTRDIRLSRQISGSPCVEGQTWGVDRGGLWVDRGCRADFFVPDGGYGPPPGPPPPQIITCSSNDGRRNWCDTGGRTEIRLNRQISGTPCVQGDTWGIDRRGLWVDRGCRAEFRVR
jgi:Protein of unknown function (DUF3011)